MTEEEVDADFIALVAEFAGTIARYIERKKDSDGMVVPGPLLIVLAALTDLSISQQAFTVGVVGIPAATVAGAIASAAHKAAEVTSAQFADWRREHGKQMDS
jgi:tRNA A37 threonylcarbamoyladenosine synthetase subunit TsaC/SUA5/YrdC